MLLNEDIIEEFKKSLTSTVKSIGKSESIEVNFVQDKSSIDGQVINLIEPDIKTLTNKLNYMRAEADSLALEIRFHKKSVHDKYLSSNDLANGILKAVEQSRIEAQGSKTFKGINENIFNKHKIDLSISNFQKNEETEIIKAFKYVSYNELTKNNLDGKFNIYKNIIKKKLGSKFNVFFDELRKNLTNQEGFAQQLQLILNELGYLEQNLKGDQKEPIDHEDNLENEDDNQKNQSDQKEGKMETDHDIESSTQDSQQTSSSEGDQEIGDDSINNELDYFPNIKSFDKIKDYKYYTNEFDEIINAEDLCDFKELERLRLSLDQQVFSFKPLIAKIANRLQRKLQAQQNRHWEFNLEEGYLDTSRLAKIITNPTHKLSFKKEKNIEFKDTIVSLLIDNSGSIDRKSVV